MPHQKNEVYSKHRIILLSSITFAKNSYVIKKRKCKNPYHRIPCKAPWRFHIRRWSTASCDRSSIWRWHEGGS